MRFKGLKLLTFMQNIAILKQQHPQRLTLKPLGQPKKSLHGRLRPWKYLQWPYMGPSRQAITAKAIRLAWSKRGSLVEKVRQEIESRLLEDPVAATVAPLEASEIVATAAKRAVAVVRRQRNLLSELLDLACATLEEL